MEALIDGKYKMDQQIGKGAFGALYHGLDTTTNQEVAIKLEKRSEDHLSHLLYESKMLKILQDADVSGIPKMYYFGEVGENHVMVMTLLGDTLEALFSKAQGKFSLVTVLLMAEQLINRVMAVHGAGLIHRDIKPENFMVGKTDPQTIYLIDFGLAKRYKDPDTGKHISYYEKRKFTGTTRYASIAAHLGIEQSRRDDMESLAYMLLRFVLGKLPWENLQTSDKDEKRKRVYNLKASTPLDYLCQDAPLEFHMFISNIKDLAFTQAPDYAYYKVLFRAMLKAIKENATVHDFDWLSIPALRAVSENKVAIDNKADKKPEDKEEKGKPGCPQGELKENREVLQAVIAVAPAIDSKK